MAVNGDDGSGDGGGYRNKLDAKHLGLKLYVWIAIGVGSVIVISLIFLLCCLRNRKRTITKRLRVKNIKNTSGSIPITSKDIEEISKLDQPNNVSVMKNQKQYEDAEEISTKAFVGMEKVDKIKRIGTGIQSAESSGSNGSQTSALSSVDGPIGWGRWYTMREMEIATRGFAVENVIGEGGYGIVYRGVLGDNSVVAVKNLFNNKGQAEQEFKVEVEAIGKVRHKNLVGLIGYCVEGSHRMLVYEYVNNGNLEQWLHGEVGPVSPLTWDIRMKIAIGTAKGLSYLHEGLEPKVVHRDVKSSNILLDRRWNPKVSDFGLAKLLGSEASYVTTRVMGTFGYVAPEYASSGKLNERSDVYSFGVLLMELISGRTPVDYSRPAGEVNLVDWLKMKVASRHGDEVVDPLIENPPPPRALKRALLVCLRCIDLEADKRPKMGQVLHMLEADEFPYRAEHRSGKDKTHIPAPQGPTPPDDTPFASRIAMGR